MSSPDELKTHAMYDHYKGGKYMVLVVGYESTNARTPGRVVIYVSLKYAQVKCRDYEEFVEMVKWPDGNMAPRFKLAEEQ